MILMDCSNVTLGSILFILRNILNIIWIVGPILTIISLTINFIKMMKNPDEKKLSNKILKSIVALIILFLVPAIVNGVMLILDDKSEISACWSGDINPLNSNSTFINTNKNKKNSLYNGRDEYENGIPRQLDFSCKSNKVKAQFSCDTLKIVEKHLYDFDATNFHSVINSKYGGDFGAYAKSVGGIFGEYYGKKMPNKTEADFQRAAEYVLGWMYMYGWDYYSEDGTNKGAHVGWTGKDAFYANGGFVGRYISDSSTPLYRGPGINFDDVISTKSQGGSTGRMACACGDLEFFIFNKLNINRTKQLPKISRLKDLKVGDCLYFGNGPKWNKLDESNWTSAYGAHNVIIGEVYDDHAVIYEMGGRYPTQHTYKKNLYFKDTEEADDAEVKRATGYTSWGIRRWYDFEK